MGSTYPMLCLHIAETEHCKPKANELSSVCVSKSKVHTPPSISVNGSSSLSPSMGSSSPSPSSSSPMRAQLNEPHSSLTLRATSALKVFTDGAGGLESPCKVTGGL